MKISTEAQKQLGKVLSFSYGTSRGRDTYGYTIVTMKADGYRVAQCNGGGYDMKGTCLADWMTEAMPEAVSKLASKQASWTYWRDENKEFHSIAAAKPAKALYGLTYHKDEKRGSMDGACGFSSVEAVLKALGLRLSWKPTSKRDGVYIVTEATK